MSNANGDEFSTLVAQVELQDVRQVEGVFATRVSAEQVVSSELAVTQGARIVRDGSALLVYVRFIGDVVPGSEDGQPAAEPASKFRAVFELRYRLPDGSFSDETLKQFAGTNAVFNAWPYWREFVQSSSLRTGLPAIVMPTFRIASTTRSARSEQESSEVAHSPAHPQKRPPARRRRRAG